MAASFFQELSVWINAQLWKPGDIEFDVHPSLTTDPYFTMLAISSPSSNKDFCSDDAGSMNIQFNGYGEDRHVLYNTMDTLKRNVKLVRNNLTLHDIWNVRTTGVVGFGTEDERVYRFTFELQTEWRLK